MATNRDDTLDPALLRPGRLDRKIEFPLPSRREKRLIFQTVTGKMNLSPEVDLEDYVSRPDRLSSAEIASICQAAGLQGTSMFPTTRSNFSMFHESRPEEQIYYITRGLRRSLEGKWCFVSLVDYTKR